jgi:carbonic anhydrase
MRERGYTAEVVERWIPGANIRKDLYGFLDILAIRDEEIVGVQATSGDNVSHRIDKITNHELVGTVRKAGIRILVHGWRKAANGRWTLREVDIS